MENLLRSEEDRGHLIPLWFPLGNIWNLSDPILLKSQDHVLFVSPVCLLYCLATPFIDVKFCF